MRNYVVIKSPCSVHESELWTLHSQLIEQVAGVARSASGPQLRVVQQDDDHFEPERRAFAGVDVADPTHACGASGSEANHCKLVYRYIQKQACISMTVVQLGEWCRSNNITACRVFYIRIFHEAILYWCVCVGSFSITTVIESVCYTMLRLSINPYLCVSVCI